MSTDFPFTCLLMSKIDSLDLQNGDDFLLREGLDLLAAYRTIRCEDARRGVTDLVAAIVRAEEEGQPVSVSFEVCERQVPVHRQ